MIQLHNSRQEEEGEQNHHGHGATAAAAGGDALSNNEHHHHHHHSRWTPGQGDASMSPTRLQFIRDTEMDANNRYTTPGAGDSSRSREQRHGTSQQIPLPPKHALDRIELLNQENRQTMEVPEYKEANPYRYMHDPDTDANFEFWDGIRQLTELQPHREYQSECAYCKRPGNNDRHAYGSIVERIQPEDYEAFLERGWMRSGRFLYLPISEKACCPNIPIRLDVTRFRAEKRHKQVLSRMHRYLEGKRPIFKLSGEKKSNDVDMGNSTENSGSSRKASGEAVLTAAISALIEHVLRTNEPTCDSICAQAYSELENSTIAHIIQALKDWKKHHLSGSAQPKLCNISPAKIRKNMGFLVSSPLALRIAQIVFREGSFDTSNHSSISLHVIRRVLAQTLVDWINKCTLCTQRFVCSMSSPGYLNFRLWNDQEQSSIEKAYSPASDLLADLRKMHSSISRFSPEPGATSNNNGNSGDPSTTRDNTHVDSRENSSCMQQPSSAIAAASEPTTPLIYHYTKFQREHFSSYGEGYEHRLKVRLTRPYYTDAHLELYVRYNTEIHDTEGKEQSKKSFMRHLVNSPIVFTPGMVQGRNTITCWPPRHDRSYHRSVPACSVHHPLDLYEPRHDVTENLQWKGKDLVWEQVPVELDSPPIHLIEFLSFMSQESHVRSFDDEDDDSCLEFPPVYRPRRNLLRWKHGLEDTHLRRLILRIFEADIQNFCPQASHFTFDSGYQPLERFKWLRTRYLKFMEERFLGLVSTANNPTALREAWEMVYEPDTLYLPSFVELATAYENISQGMRKIQSGLTAHRSIADNRRIDVTGSPLSRENYSDGRHMLGSYLDKDEFGNERDPEEEGWDLSMGYGTFFQEYWLDGFLVCVSVLDILPTRLASVYCFYNPDLRHMEWGKYSALTEIYWTQRAAEYSPILRYVDMNFYVHQCPRMNYKRYYAPSELKCPYSLTWVSVDEALPLLDADTHSPLHPRGTEIRDQRDAECEAIAAEIIRDLCFCHPSESKYPAHIPVNKTLPRIIGPITDDDILSQVRYIPWNRLTEHYRHMLFPRIVDWIKRTGQKIANRVIIDPFALVYYAQLDEEKNATTAHEEAQDEGGKTQEERNSGQHNS